MPGTSLSTLAFYILSFSPLKMSFHWPLTSTVSHEMSGMTVMVLNAVYFPSLAAFITLSVVLFSVSVSLCSAPIVVYFCLFVCLYLACLEFTELLGSLCSRFWLNLKKLIFLFLLIIFLLSLWDYSYTYVKLLNIVFI